MCKIKAQMERKAEQKIMKYWKAYCKEIICAESMKQIKKICYKMQ